MSFHVGCHSLATILDPPRSSRSPGIVICKGLSPARKGWDQAPQRAWIPASCALCKWWPCVCHHSHVSPVGHSEGCTCFLVTWKNFEPSCKWAAGTVLRKYSEERAGEGVSTARIEQAESAELRGRRHIMFLPTSTAHLGMTLCHPAQPYSWLCAQVSMMLDTEPAGVGHAHKCRV